MKNKKSIFSNSKRFYGFMCMVLLLFISVSGTFAYYRFGANATIKANTASYNFNISSDAISTTKINLGSNLKPYDKGSFTINVNMPNTESDVQYSIDFERVNLPEGFKFLTNDDNVSPFNNYTKYYKAADTKTDSVTIYWYWDGDVSDSSDSSFIGKTISANLVIKSRTVNGADMKNGFTGLVSGNTEFWNDTYRPYIRTITFQNNLSNLPTTCNEANLCWDLSASTTQTKKVYGYLIDSGLKDKTDSTKTLYNLYIVSDYEIMATSCNYMFSDFKNLISINFNDLFNTSKVTNMRGMFSGCLALTSLDLSSLNTSNVSLMNNMFHNCPSLKNLNLSSFNTSSVTSLGIMFYGCSSLTNLDLSNFNTSSVTTLEVMFYGCTSLKTIDLSSFNTSKVTAMNNMFSLCSSLKTLDLSNFDTSSVTTMALMFYNCTSLEKLDLSNFNTSKVTNLNATFNNCPKLTTKIKFLNSNITEYDSAFTNCANVGNAMVIVEASPAAVEVTRNIVATKNSGDNVIFDDGTPVMMKNGYNSDSTLRTAFWKDEYKPYIRTINFTSDLSNKPSSCTEANKCWNIAYSTDQNANVYAYMIDSGFKDSSNNVLYNLYIASPIKISAPVDCNALFYGFTSVVAINFNSHFDTSQTENMKFMFQKLSSLSYLDLSGINTSNVTDMSYMFSKLTSMETIDLSPLDTSNVTDMTGMFWESTGFTTLDLSTFNTSKVNNISALFRDCTNLKNLNLKNFDTTNITDFTDAFLNCSKLITTITIRTTSGTHGNVFNGAATETGSKVTVNYSTGCYNKASSMVATKTTNANVVLGGVDDSTIGEALPAMMKNGYTVKSSGAYSLSYFWQYKDYIKEINIKDNLTNKPNNCTEATKCWDVSYASNQSAKVYAWLETSGSDSSGNTLYRLTIASTEKIYAPADSSYMFSDFGNLLGISIANDSFDTSKVTNYNYIFKNTQGVAATLTIRSEDPSNVTCIGMFNNAALTTANTGVNITLNYTSATSSLVDKMIATKSTNSVVTKGSLVS